MSTSRRRRLSTLRWLLLAAAWSGACGDGPTEPTGATTPPASTRVLIDASRDGGAYWFGDPAYQGRPLADYLRGRGFDLTELRPPTEITGELLAPYDLVIRTSEYGGYALAERDAYRSWVEGGGALLLLSDYQRYGERDRLAETFGILLRGVTVGENVIDLFAPHPITQGVQPLSYVVGSAFLSVPPSGEALASLSVKTFLDMDDDGIYDPGERIGPAVLGRMPYGSGEIVFCGDTNMWETVPQPLLDNTIAWLLTH